MRSSERKAVHNRSIRTKVRTMEKNYRRLAAEQKVEEAGEALAGAFSVLDKAAKTGVIKQTKADNKKARLAANFNKTRAAHSAIGA